jgi:large subunit ribosomal protein L18
MNRLTHKVKNNKQRKNRVRSTVIGTTKRPRLSVHISNYHVTAQIIDDSASNTLAYASSVGAKDVPENLIARAEWVGTKIAQDAMKKKIKTVVFDRGGKLYHGRVKTLADAARKEGLEF